MNKEVEQQNTEKQVWECVHDGVRKLGESCRRNDNCKFPKCLNQIAIPVPNTAENDGKEQIAYLEGRQPT